MIEVMISMGLVLIGMMAFFRVLIVSQRGASTGQRFTQAEGRAQQILEAMRTAPAGVLACLAANAPPQWPACENQCVGALGAAASPQSCVFYSLSAIALDRDGTSQQYAVVSDPASAPAPFGDRSSWVRLPADTPRIYDAQVTIGWNDDGSAPGLPFDHRLTLRTAIYR